MYKSILLAADGSENSLRAAEEESVFLGSDESSFVNGQVLQ